MQRRNMVIRYPIREYKALEINSKLIRQRMLTILI